MPDFFQGKSPERKPATSTEKGAVIIIGLALATFFGIDIYRDFTPVKLSIPFFLVSWGLLLFVHEFGHALMARLLGWRVELISLGIGEVFSRRRILGMPVEIRTIPISGFILPRPADLIAPRLKEFLIYAAGPGAELASVGVACGIFGTDSLLNPTHSIPIIAAQSFCVAALWGVATNLLPISFASDKGRSASDGLGMLICWMRPDSYYTAWIESTDAAADQP